MCGWVGWRASSAPPRTAFRRRSARTPPPRARQPPSGLAHRVRRGAYTYDEVACTVALTWRNGAPSGARLCGLPSIARSVLWSRMPYEPKPTARPEFAGAPPTSLGRTTLAAKRRPGFPGEAPESRPCAAWQWSCAEAARHDRARKRALRFAVSCSRPDPARAAADLRPHAWPGTTQWRSPACSSVLRACLRGYAPSPRG